MSHASMNKILRISNIEVHPVLNIFTDIVILYSTELYLISLLHQNLVYVNLNTDHDLVLLIKISRSLNLH